MAFTMSPACVIGHWYQTGRRQPRSCSWRSRVCCSWQNPPHQQAYSWEQPAWRGR